VFEKIKELGMKYEILEEMSLFFERLYAVLIYK